MNIINKRLTDILFKEKGLTAYQIGKAIETSTQNVENWLGKGVMPGADWFGKICMEYKINPYFALYGQMPKYFDDTSYTKIITKDLEKKMEEMTFESIAEDPLQSYNKQLDKLQENFELKLLRRLVDVYRNSEYAYLQLNQKLNKDIEQYKEEIKNLKQPKAQKR